MAIVFVCSPFSGDIARTTERARGYCRFVLSHDCVPFAPHLHNPQFLDEYIPRERKIGIELGLEVLKRTDALWVFGGRITDGMREEIRYATENQIPVKYFDENCLEVENYG